MKKFLCLGVVLALSLFIVGCGESKAPHAKPASPPATHAPNTTEAGSPVKKTDEAAKTPVDAAPKP